LLLDWVRFGKFLPKFPIFLPSGQKKISWGWVKSTTGQKSAWVWSGLVGQGLSSRVKRNLLGTLFHLMIHAFLGSHQN